jgi:hypothetical protein
MRRLTTLIAALMLVFGLSLVALGGADSALADGHNCEDYGYSFPIDPNNDPNNLDGDGDGIACEEYAPGGGGGSSSGGDTSGSGTSGTTTMPAAGVGPDFSSESSSFMIVALSALAGLFVFAGLRLQKRS